MFKFITAILMLSAEFAATCVATSSDLEIDNFCFAKRDLLAMISCYVPFGWNTTA